MTRQTAIANQVKRWGWRTVTGISSNPERVSGIAVRLAISIIIRFGDLHLAAGETGHLFNRRSARHWSHGIIRHRNNSGDRRAVGDFTVRQCTRARSRATIGTYQGSRFEDIVDPPQAPHPLGKVRIEMAMENGVSRRLVAVAASAPGNFVSIG